MSSHQKYVLLKLPCTTQGVYIILKSLFTQSICLNDNKKITFSPRTIANTLFANNSHFVNLASVLVKKLPDPT